jgi:hypothetical protein
MWERNIKRFEVDGEKLSVAAEPALHLKIRHTHRLLARAPKQGRFMTICFSSSWKTRLEQTAAKLPLASNL